MRNIDRLCQLEKALARSRELSLESSHASKPVRTLVVVDEYMRHYLATRVAAS